MYTPHVRDIIGGGVRGTWETGKFLYKHPLTGMLPLAGAIGLGTAAFGRNNRLTTDISASPSIVEAMGGQSEYGVRQMMEMMNADGDLVLGMHNRR
jgi:hypothetical protein